MAERGIFVGGFSLRRNARVGDGKGGFVTGPAEFDTPRGRITPLSLTEADRALQTVGLVTHRFSTASGTDVQVNDQIVFATRTYKVQAISTTSTGQRKQCLCEEVNDVSG